MATTINVLCYKYKTPVQILSPTNLLDDSCSLYTSYKNYSKGRYETSIDNSWEIFINYKQSVFRLSHLFIKFVAITSSNKQFERTFLKRCY